MSAGFQAWDSNGNLVVDLGDYSCRLATALTFNISPSTAQITRVGISGITGNNHFANISNAAPADFAHSLTDIYVKTVDGGIDVFLLAGSTGFTYAIQIDIYVFI